MSIRTFLLIVAASHLASGTSSALELRAPSDATPPEMKIVTLGDSVTKGVRPGVKPAETFAALLQEQLRAKGLSVHVVNVGIGGDRTDQALLRLKTDVVKHEAQVVTIMYGTNDSYVDRGEPGSRLSRDVYRANLQKLVRDLRLEGIEPVLMTEPRWAQDAAPNGLGEHPNQRLARYVEVCREVAREEGTQLVDHFAHWTQSERNGVRLRDWMTDGCHPNPRGHKEMAATMLPVLLKVIQPPAVRTVISTLNSGWC